MLLPTTESPSPYAFRPLTPDDSVDSIAILISFYRMVVNIFSFLLY
jgi:hypothetical protein